MGIINDLFSRFTRKPPTMGTMGTMGTYALGGYLQTNEKDGRLAHLPSRVKRFKDMATNVWVVAMSLRYHLALLSGVGWNIEPTEENAEDAEAIEYAETIQKMLNQMEIPFFKVVRHMGKFKWIGHSVQEMIAKRMDEVKPGFIGIGRIEHRPQDTLEQWALEPKSGEVVGWMQRDPGTGELHALSRAKCIYIFDDTIDDSPDGVGLYRHLVKLCEELQKLERLEGWSFETDLRGVPKISAPLAQLDDMVRRGMITALNKEQMLEGVKRFAENHFKVPGLGLMIDSSVFIDKDPVKGTPSAARMWDVELMKGDASGLDSLGVAVDRKCREIARLIGTEQFLLGDSKGGLGGGGGALSEDKTANLTQIVTSTLTECSWTLDHDFLDFIFTINNWDIAKKPQCKPDAVHLRSVAEICTNLKTLADAGAPMLPDDPVINQLRDMMQVLHAPDLTPEQAGVLAGTILPHDPNLPRDPETGQPVKPMDPNLPRDPKTGQPVKPMDPNIEVKGKVDAKNQALGAKAKRDAKAKR